MSESVRYASGEVPELNDRVRLLSVYEGPHTGEVCSTTPFTFVDDDGDKRRYMTPKDCYLVARAPRDLPAIDGAGVFHRAAKKKYHFGETPEPGDTVECIESIDDLSVGERYTVHSLVKSGYWVCLNEIDRSFEYFPGRFKLIARKNDQRPAAAPEPVAPAAPAPQAVGVERFTITHIGWTETHGKIYCLSSDDFQGLEAVDAADYDAMEQRCEAAEREVARLHKIIGDCELIAFDNCTPPQLWSWVGDWEGGAAEPLQRIKNAKDAVKELSTLTAERDALQKRLDAIAAAVGGAKGGA
jgi:hypothetical protein